MLEYAKNAFSVGKGLETFFFFSVAAKPVNIKDDFCGLPCGALLSCRKLSFQEVFGGTGETAFSGTQFLICRQLLSFTIDSPKINSQPF